MNTASETILIPMMDGNAKPQEVISFEHNGHALSVRKISERLCYILHRKTGLKITGEHTGDPIEAAEGFKVAVDIGAYDLSKLESVAAKSPALNPDPKPTFRTDLTEAGEQTVIPGCEADAKQSGAFQLNLF